MTDELEYRWATDRDLSSYEAFLQENYGPGAVQVTPGRARWLFWEHPFGLHVALCLMKGRIVGACGHLPHPVVLGGRRELAAFGVDMMVSAAMRRRGIARRLLQMRLERFTVSVSSGQSEGMASLYDRVGARDLGALHAGRWRRRLPPLGPPRRFARDLFAWIQPRRTVRKVRIAGRIPLPSHAAAERIAALLESDSHACDPESGADWFLWRYDGPVYRDYQFWAIQAEGGFEGVLVARREQDSELVVDLLAPAAHRRVLLEAVGRTTDAGVLILAAGSGVVADLRAAGYFTRPRSGRLVALSELGDRTGDLGDLEFWAGASDIDLTRHPSS